MTSARRTSAALALSLMVACSPDLGAEGDEHAREAEGEPLGTASAALSAASSVSAAVTQSCTTTSVKGLATQLVEEIQCLHPAMFARIDGLAGLSLGAAVFPYLQTSAAAALVAAQKARGATMTIHSGLRTLPQQYLLYRWYQAGRCGIPLAAAPGSSNHESALAVDIDDNTGWRTSMTSQGFRWLGSNDPVHFDFVGAGTKDIDGLSVLAFQRLWNRNHPADLIAEDGDYGPVTEQRLASAPVGGFAIGAFCKQATLVGPDLGTVPPVIADPPLGPVRRGGDVEAPATQPATLPVDEAGPEELAASSEGCSTSPRRGGAGWLALLALAIGAASMRRGGRTARRA